jgi:hypothetical protein
MNCPESDRTRLLKKQVGDLQTWLNRDKITELELAYWIPKYILMQGGRPFAKLGKMSPSMLSLAKSQDSIGWRRFMEGHITTHFHICQRFHLTMSSSYLNRDDWTKQFISKLLIINHSQWIYMNISLHSTTTGYLHEKSISELKQDIDKLLVPVPEEVPVESRFLLEIKPEALTQLHN